MKLAGVRKFDIDVDNGSEMILFMLKEIEANSSNIEYSFNAHEYFRFSVVVYLIKESLRISNADLFFSFSVVEL